MIFESDIRSVEYLLLLSLTHGCHTKFKRKSDKRWYTFRAFARRLIQRRMNNNMYEELNVLLIFLPSDIHNSPSSESTRLWIIHTWERLYFVSEVRTVIHLGVFFSELHYITI